MKPTRLPGSALFVRYAYPPNALGYCGPSDSTAFRAYGLSGAAGPELVRLARSFTGAWPYLVLIAGQVGIADPLDRRVVEAYWVGNRLLDAVDVERLAGPPFGRLAGDTARGGTAHHSYHVLCGYPWVGLLADPRASGRALTVLDRCRIRWGRVTAVDGERVTVRSRPLSWDGRRLDLGSPVGEQARMSIPDGAELTVGDRVALHWDWVCDQLSERQVRALRRYTRKHLDLVNQTQLSTAAPARGQSCQSVVPVGSAR